MKNSFNYTNCDDETKFPTHNNFYVDDFLKWVWSEEEAISTIKNVTNVLSNVGFKPTTFNSNSPKVLAELPLGRTVEESFIYDITSYGETRTLGVIWRIKEDKFSENHRWWFWRMYLNKKRNILKPLASTFYPLGLVSHIQMIGKIIPGSL